MKTWASRIETWNEMVRAGRGQEVARELKAIPRGELPPEALARIANLSWRINRPRTGLRLLFPELRRQRNLRASTNPDAFAEYAACLVEVGALSEASQILREIEPGHIKAKFYLALLLFRQWDYEGALPLLQSYLEKIPADYHQLVVRVNLAAAEVVTERFDQALKNLTDLEAELIENHHHLLLGNVYEIWSQIHFAEHDHKRALALLHKSDQLLRQTRNMGWLYTRKWILLNERAASGQDWPPLAEDPEELLLRETAVGMGSWETIRELDLYRSLMSGDSGRLNQVYFGSPLPAYRRRVLKLQSSSAPALELSEVFRLGSNEAKDVFRLKDILHGTSVNGPTFLERRLLAILVSDLYAPFRTGQIFSQLFPEEYYDLDTSPDRVFQIVRRLRSWLRQNCGSSEIVFSPRGYRLSLDSRSAFLIERPAVNSESFSKVDLELRRVLECFGRESFSARDLGEKIGRSQRSANRLIRTLVDEGHAISEGQGRLTRFKLVS